MKKVGRFFVCLVLCLCMCVSLSACSLETMGDAVGLDLQGYADLMLGSVAWPNGSSASDFTAFISGVMGDLNLDSAVNSVDIEKSIKVALEALDVEISEENSEELEETIRKVLEENGVDTENIEIDVESVIKSISESDSSANTETEDSTDAEENK